MIGKERRSDCGAWAGRTLLVLCLLAAAGRAPAQDALLSPLPAPDNPLYGARLTAQPNPVAAAPHGLLLPAHLQWMRPEALAARNGILYVADSGRRQIFRYDTVRRTMSPFAEYAADAVRAMAVGPDLSLYVADARARQVLHFAADGRLLRRFQNEFDLGSPAAVLPDEQSGQVLVADSLYNQILVFNSLGQAVTSLKSMETRGIDAMARGPDGLYVLDRHARQVVVLGPDGRDRYTFGSDALVDPSAIAVDRFNRVYVGDRAGHAIKVFERGDLIAAVGGAASAVSFNRIAGLWLDHDLLYAADSLNARIQVFRIAPPGAPTDPPDRRADD